MEVRIQAANDHCRRREGADGQLMGGLGGNNGVSSTVKRERRGKKNTLKEEGWVWERQAGLSKPKGAPRENRLGAG